MAINLDIEISSEVAKARAEFAEIHGESVQIGSVHYYSKSYKGTPEDIEKLRELSQDPKFREEHRGHRVFAVGSSIVSFLPESFLNSDQTAERLSTRKFYQDLKEAGVEPGNCAIITVKAPSAKPVHY